MLPEQSEATFDLNRWSFSRQKFGIFLNFAEKKLQLVNIISPNVNWPNVILPIAIEQT